MLSDYFKIGLLNLLQRKLRAGLTALGIIIGVAAIIGLMSVGQGLDSSLTGQFEQIGTNRIYVNAKGGGDISTRSGLTSDDAEVLESMSEFEFVSPFLSKGAQMTFGQEEEFVGRIIGYPTDDMKTRIESYGFQVEKGRYLTPQDRYAMIIGAKAVDFFDRELRVGSNVEVRDQKFRIVGIMSVVGNPEDDTVVYIPLDTAQELFDSEDQVSLIEAEVKTGFDVNAVAEKTFRRVEKARGDDEFEISTAEQLIDQIGGIVSALNAVLVAIAAISLLVGGLGIMNSMYTSVLERTKEIGIMKALGAQNKDILTIFMIESALLSGVGGIIGSAIGLGFGSLVGFIASSSGYEFIQIQPSIPLFFFGVGFAVVVGILSGILPARQAIKMNAVDAMRS